MEGFDTSSLIEVGNLATELSSDAWLWMGNFLVLIVLTVILIIFALQRGSSGLVSLNLSLYAAYAIYMVFPYRDAVIGIGDTPIIQAILSISLFIAATVIPFILTLRLTSQSFGALSILQNLVLSFLAASFLMALAYHVFDISNIYTFSDPLNQLFEPKGYFFYWFIAPLIGVYFLAR
jgi:hypothetical protein